MYCLDYMNNYKKADYNKKCFEDFFKDMLSLSKDIYDISTEMFKILLIMKDSPELFPQPKGKNANNRYGKSIEECNILFNRLSKKTKCNR